MTILHKIEGHSKNFVFATALLLTAVVGTIDFLTGAEIGVGILYLVPIGYVAWFCGRGTGYFMSVVGIVTAVLSDALAGKIYRSLPVEIWNSLVRLGFFIIVTYLLSRLKCDLDERARIISELKKALAEIKTLSGLLPICAWCRRIRDDKGYWKQVEQYVAEHTEAEFTHGICPECLKKMEPELYEKIIRKEETGKSLKSRGGNDPAP